MAPRKRCWNYKSSSKRTTWCQMSPVFVPDSHIAVRAIGKGEIAPVGHARAADPERIPVGPYAAISVYSGIRPGGVGAGLVNGGGGDRARRRRGRVAAHECDVPDRRR